MKDLGLDDRYLAQRGGLQRPDERVARITAVDRDAYLVRNERSEVPARLTGKALFDADSSEQMPCVGDWVVVHYHDDGAFALVHELLPRRSILRRKAAGKRTEYQLLAANVDVAFLVQSCDLDFNPRRLERYLVTVQEGGIRPAVLLSKSDLVDPGELQQRIAAARRSGMSCPVLAFSNLDESGPDRVRQMMSKGKTYCLLGSSGVGKTTLLNHLLGREAFATSTIREKDGKGRHTTTRRQLIVLDDGAMLIDNPGMRELGVIGAQAGIDESFAEIQQLSGSCRFRDCTHTREAGCAVLAAIEEGALSEERYRSYLKLSRESEYYEMSYLEKRRKDRQFGQFVKSVMKHKKKPGS